jgi:glycerol kinase
MSPAEEQVMKRHVLAIDQGTTGTTVMIFDAQGRVRGRAYSEFRQHYPHPGWVEHDAEEIWTVTRRVIQGALRKARLKAADLAAVGITNQRETTVLWDRASGKPIHRAIVWQDRRTAPFCSELEARGAESILRNQAALAVR